MKNNNVAGIPGHDPTLPDVELQVDGEIYHLSYDFNAIVQAEKVTGINLFAALIGDISAISLRGLLWSALLKDQPDMTIEEAGSLIHPLNIGAIRSAIITAWYGSIKEDSAGGDEAPTKGPILGASRSASKRAGRLRSTN